MFGGRRPREGEIGAGVEMGLARDRRANRGRKNAALRAEGRRRDSIASSQASAASNVSAVDRVRMQKQQGGGGPPRSHTTTGYEPSMSSGRSTGRSRSVEPVRQGQPHYGSPGNRMGGGDGQPRQQRQRQQHEHRSPAERRLQEQREQQLAQSAADMRASVPRLSGSGPFLHQQNQMAPRGGAAVVPLQSPTPSVISPVTSESQTCRRRSDPGGSSRGSSATAFS
eukprot:SAG22_NODE_2110_length_3002_cov_1.545298_2_plen_225_part_00